MDRKILIQLLFLIIITNSKYALSQSNLEVIYPFKNTTIDYHDRWTKNHYKKRIKKFKKQPIHPGDIVFIGNSITEGGKDWGAKLKIDNVKNRGISGDVTDGVLSRLGELIKYEPKSIFIMIGVNDLFNLYYRKEIPSPDYVINNLLKITTLLHEKLPNTKLYLQTLLPTARDFINEKIDIVNASIRIHQSDGTYSLIDLNPHFATDDGLINTSLTYDGTHLNSKGYFLWSELIMKYL
jgi:lysophospholipase L1-like esterase